MVSQEDEYPQFPKLECSACGERFEVPRKWAALRGFGNQIIIDWISAEPLMKTHHEMHNDELVTGVEEYLRANT
jgi:hypothetical protein